MQGWYEATQLILQILRDPAWSGVGGFCALLGIPLAVLLARQSKISHPQKPRTAKINQNRRPASTHETRYFLRDGYHRLTLVNELVKDVDIMVVLDAKNSAL